MGDLLTWFTTKRPIVSGEPINTAPRNIASGVRNPGIGSGSISNGTNTQQNMRSAHFNQSGVALDEVRVVYGGWYTNVTNEVANANDYTVTASIEYPAGTFAQVTWGGATSKVITAGDNIESDYASVSIPVGAQFWVRTFVQVTAGQTWPLCRTLATALGEVCEFAVSGLADKTMSGTITGTQQGLRPAAIVAPWKSGMKKVSMAGLGDSIIYGSGDDLYDNRGNTSWIGRAASDNCPYLPIAVTGTTLANQVLTDKMNYRLDLMNKAGITHIVCNWGINDVGSGFSTFQTNLNTLWATIKAAMPSVKLYHCTLGPRATASSNRNYYVNANQTPHADYNGSGATGNLINAYIRTAPSPLAGFIENADRLSKARDSGLWKNGTEQPGDAALMSADSCTVTGSPTTTNVPYTPLQPSGYYLVGTSNYTTGALAGTFAGGSQFSSNASALTYGSAPLASAPAAGNLVTVYPAASRATTDGLHPNIASKGTTAVLGGGHVVLRDGLIPVIQSWL